MPSSCDITNCQIPIRVRYYEADRQNAVHHSRYAVYFEMGRTELLRINGCDYKTLEDNGIILVVARLEIRYKQPARYDDELLLTTSLGRIDRMRLEHHYEITRPADQKTITLGKTVLVHIDQTGKLQPLPAFLFPAKNEK
ncbi:acyl-CoA thioesterase [Planctomycetota bacterium]